MNKRLTLFVILGLVIAAVVSYLIFQRWFRLANDEAPIIVKNGSITAEISSGVWVPGDNSYRHVTGNSFGNNLWVQIELTTQPCADISGNQVHIDYSVPGPQTTFHGSNTGTSLTPRSEFRQETTMRLRRGQLGDGGYISGVRAGSSKGCDFTQANLRAICIWRTSSFDRGLCQ